MAQDKSAEEKKRRVKNPETFRERAVKANTAKDVSRWRKRLFSWPKKVFKAIFMPLVKLNRRLKKVKPLRPIYFVLRMIGLVIFPKYFRSSFRELQRVTWPGFKLSLRLTYAVLIFAIIFGSSVALLDYGLDKVFKAILLK